MTKLLTASTAHEQSAYSNKKAYEKQRQTLANLINDAIERGDFSIRYNDFLLPDIINELKDLDYEVYRRFLSDASEEDYAYDIKW